MFQPHMERRADDTALKMDNMVAAFSIKYL
jgi:hypothetical protein